MNKIIFILIVLILLTACTTQTIEEIKNPEHVGKQVIIKGTVENTIKIGSLSGYTLKDKTGATIKVSSEELPKEGSKETVKGILMKDLLLGYYVKSN